jgi:hypothetical protein
MQDSGLSAPTPAGMAAASMPKQEEKEKDNKAKGEAQKQETKKDNDTKDESDEQAKKKNDTPVDTKSDQKTKPSNLKCGRFATTTTLLCIYSLLESFLALRQKKI